MPKTLSIITKHNDTNGYDESTLVLGNVSGYI